MKTVKLVDREGSLYVPAPGDDYFGRFEAILIYVYPAGDCDVACWPMVEERDKWILGGALYGAVECGLISHMHGDFVVQLPNGENFNYMDWVR
jgi:hypothetical protein